MGLAGVTYSAGGGVDETTKMHQAKLDLSS